MTDYPKSGHKINVMDRKLKYQLEWPNYNALEPLISYFVRSKNAMENNELFRGFESPNFSPKPSCSFSPKVFLPPPLNS